MAAYEYRHVVGFEETSLVGNVYFTNYFLWQGHCRELFLRDHAPLVLQMMGQREVMFFTRNCSCEYVGDWGFLPLDSVLIRMRLARFRGGRLTLAFDYYNDGQPDVLIARGTQEIDCKAQLDGQWYAEPFPVPLVEALLRFADEPQLVSALHDALDHHRAKAGARQNGS
jgi:enediyne biosynthesis thioesterase